MYKSNPLITGLKITWKVINFIRQLFLNILFVLFLLFTFGIISILKNSDQENMLPQHGILVVDLEGVIVDSTSNNDDLYAISKKLSGKKVDRSRENSLFELVQKIDQATKDAGITGMILKLDNFANADLPSLRYIGKYLNEFKKSGKVILATSNNYDQKQYYLASFANHIYLAPQGNIQVFGLSANNFYFKTLLDNLKIDTHVFRVGKYKSAVEPFIRDDMSQEARANASRWLNAMWQHYVTDISQSRKTAPQILVPTPKEMLDSLKENNGDMSAYALQHKLADSLITPSEFNDEMIRQYAGKPLVSIYDYKLKPTESYTNNLNKSKKPLIAVVFINGTIAEGESSQSVAGSDTIVNYLEKVRSNYNIEALVLRINSPGGGVFASEAIRSELAQIKSTRNIPIITSMGGLTASGGYWIATASNAIVADKDTITGSIGIFGILPNFERSLAHIGINNDGVSTSPLASLNVTKELTSEYQQLIQLNIENGYDTFLKLVAQSRKMDYQDVDKIAQGQVWLGEEALKIGLVDQLGDLDDAVKLAAQKANLTNYTIDWQKAEFNWLDAIINDYSAVIPSSALDVLYKQLPISKQLTQQLNLFENLNDPQNRYIYCLNCAEIK
ncbi:signal peptide peptidase SppA [Orbaceae bacterium ac157xtp]